MKKILCPRCGKEPAIVDKTYGVLPGKKCQARDAKSAFLKIGPQFVNISKSDRIQHQRDYGAKDLLQPFIRNKPNPEFVRAYPELIDNYYNKKEIKNL